MYIYMGMFFNSPQDVPDFGSIKMYFVGTKELGYVEEGHKRFRKYAFQSTDLSKLSLITNAIDGSEAFAVDTGSTYVLYNSQWNIKSTNSNLAPEDMISIDYQVVQTLPNNGEKGIIYLIEHNMGEGNSFDEYIWVNGSFEKIGNTAIDLSGYMQKINISSNEQIGQIPKIKSDGNLESSGFTLNKSVPANAVFTDTTYNIVTTETAGLMDSTDKIKLNNIDFGANKTIVDSALSNSSTNPVQNMIIKNALDNKLNTTLKGTNNGLAELDSTGKVPSTQLPSYVDAAYEHSLITMGNPHNVTKSDLELDNVENKSSEMIRSELTSLDITTALGYTPSSSFTDTTYSEATQSTAGLMSASDKTKLDSIPDATNLLTSDDIIVCTQAEYDAIQTKTGLIYLIKEQ